MGKPIEFNPAQVPATADQRASQYARSLIEASLDPLVTIGPEGKITDVNEATVKVTGVARERLIGTDITERVRLEEQLRAQLDELRRFQRVTVDRELRLQELEQRLTKLTVKPGKAA